MMIIIIIVIFDKGAKLAMAVFKDNHTGHINLRN